RAAAMAQDGEDMPRDAQKRIVDLRLDEQSILRRNPDIEHERRVAIFDLLEDNYFAPVARYPDGYPGPYRLVLRMEDNRLAIDVFREEGDLLETIILDRKSTRLNSSHVKISYAVFCLKKKKKHKR